MSNDHFGMPSVSSFCRIIWKIVEKIYEEAHIYFYRDGVMNFTLFFYGCLLPRSRSAYISNTFFHLKCSAKERG